MVESIIGRGLERELGGDTSGQDGRWEKRSVGEEMEMCESVQ